MSVCKVTYFNAKGINEPIRFLLKYGGIEFEDIRLEYEDWPRYKNEIPFGQVPIYEENGKKINQSIAIERYLAKKVKLVGDNDWEDLEIDAVVDTIQDFRMKISKLHFEEDEEKKVTYKEKLTEEILPYFLKRFEAIAEKNDGHLAVERLTWADFCFAGILDCLNKIVGKDIIADYPNLQQVKENVCNIPVIKKWIETRPVTDF